MPRRAVVTSAPLIALLALGTACKDDDPTQTSDGPTSPPGDASATDELTTGGSEDTSGSGGTGSTGDEADSPVWDTPYCYPVAGAMKWPEPLPSWEAEVVVLVNAARATGGDCRSGGTFLPSDPLTVDASLHCAARVHSKDMADRDFFDHINPDGEDPFVRIARAGYDGSQTQAENIAAGTDTARATVDGWLASDGHCAIMLSPLYDEIGVGAYEGAGQFVYYWTQTFAARD